MKTRLDLFRALPAGATVLEVGVYHADFMAEIMWACPKLKYIGVDSWLGRFGEAKRGAYARAASVQNASLINMPSIEASGLFKPESFDLVYIDGNHLAKSVTADLTAWKRTVKAGGILAGHDYETKPATPEWEAIEVKGAVDAFFASLTKPAKVNVIEETCPTWWVKL